MIERRKEGRKEGNVPNFQRRHQGRIFKCPSVSIKKTPSWTRTDIPTRLSKSNFPSFARVQSSKRATFNKSDAWIRSLCNIRFAFLENENLEHHIFNCCCEEFPNLLLSIILYDDFYNESHRNIFKNNLQPITHPQHQITFHVFPPQTSSSNISHS